MSDPITGKSQMISGRHCMLQTSPEIFQKICENRTVAKGGLVGCLKNDCPSPRVVISELNSPDLPSSSRDMRVISTLLLVRKAFDQLFPGTYLHAVGENCFDSTASLALTPYGKHQADFVNTQAIYARALTLTLAFPLSQPAIAQLFHQQSDSPCLKLASAGNEVIPLGTATFAQVSRAVAKKYQGAVCTYIGIHFWFIPQNG